MQANYNLKLSLSLIFFITFSNYIFSMEEDDFLNDILAYEPSGKALNILPEDCPAEQLLELLVNGGAVSLLQKDIYLKTNPLNIRSLLDMPSLFPILRFPLPCHYKHLYGTVFYNQMRKAYFTKDSPFIDSYINLVGKDLIESLGEDTPLKDAGFDEVLDLFAGMKIEERRLGAMIGYLDMTENHIYNIYMPIYYLEHNFFLTPDERTALINSQFFKDYGVQGDNQGEMDFAYNHLVNDRLGIGDTRIDIKYKIHSHTHLDIWFGFQSTIPTAITCKNGVAGNSFNSTCYTPQFDLLSVMAGVVCSKSGSYEYNKAQQDGIDLMVAALDSLSANLVNVSMGNRGHFGLGPQVMFDQKITCNLELLTNICWEYLFVAKEDRAFLVNKKDINFDRDWATEDPAIAIGNINFLSQQIVNTLFPNVIRVSVTPGSLFKLTSKLQYHTYHNDFVFGFDFWNQSNEKVSGVYSCLDCCKGLKPSAYQGKIVAQWVYNFHGRSADGRFGLVSDATIFNKGIGKDFNVGIYAGIDF